MHALALAKAVLCCAPLAPALRRQRRSVIPEAAAASGGGSSGGSRNDDWGGKGGGGGGGGGGGDSGGNADDSSQVRLERCPSGRAALLCWPRPSPPPRRPGLCLPPCPVAGRPARRQAGARPRMPAGLHPQRRVPGPAPMLALCKPADPVADPDPPQDKNAWGWQGWRDRVAFDAEFPFKVLLEQVRRRPRAAMRRHGLRASGRTGHQRTQHRRRRRLKQRTHARTASLPARGMGLGGLLMARLLA
jgi:hypothetical protein